MLMFSNMEKPQASQPAALTIARHVFTRALLFDISATNSVPFEILTVLSCRQKYIKTKNGTLFLNVLKKKANREKRLSNGLLCVLLPE